ncbi:hypothetical protein JCM10908_001130 [Rhodotorula pacifica]|uniref:uncharacterized protein n=1 Tax=Rhodotorula pacifica TaxID=1495444 RepID=UPI00317201FA
MDIGLRAASPQLSKRHGRDPNSLESVKPAVDTPSTPETHEQEPEDDDVSEGDSDPIENISDSDKALSSLGARRKGGQSEWYRFSAPTRLDAQRSTPYIDNVTRLENRLARAAGNQADGGGGGGVADGQEVRVQLSSTKWEFKMVGQWRIGELLGKGTSGQVRLVRNIRTGVFAALKRVIHLPDDHKHAHSIHREVCIMKIAANHPHLIQLYDIYETDDHYYILTEYTELGELFQYVQQNLMLPQYVHRFFCQLMSAVAHLARFRICHRDIKLENIMLWRDEDGEISTKLIDFGMAAYQPEGELLTMSCGSPHYAAPEIMEGYAYDGIKSDTWSCAVVLYAMIARVLPFDDDDIPTLMNKVRVGAYEMPPSIQDEARDLIQRCLVKDVSDRMSLPDVLAHPYVVQPIDPAPRNAFRVFQRVDPPRAAYEVNEPLVDEIVSDVAMLLGIDDPKVVEKQIRLPLNTHARVFYLVFLGYRMPSRVVQEQQRQLQPLKSCFESSGPSSESAYTSSASTRRSSSTPAVAFPLPPLDTQEPVNDLVFAPRRSLTGPGTLIPDDVDPEVLSQRGERTGEAATSPRDAPTGRDWDAINDDYVFPRPQPQASPTLSLPDTPQEKQTDFAVPLASAPPQIESFAVEPLPISPEVLMFPPSSHRMSVSGTPSSLERKGIMHSVPTSPTLVTSNENSPPVPLKGAATTSAGQQLRTKASIHQRLRSIFSAQHVRQKSSASAASRLEKADPASPAAQPRLQRQRPHPIAVRWSVSDAGAEADTEGERSPSPTHSAHSAHSSVLKRSDAYSSLDRALAGKPPVSPALRSFGAILGQGAAAPNREGGKARKSARDKSTFQIYEDSDGANDCPETPRASALNKQILSPKGVVASEEADAKGWRLLRKASSHVVGRVRGTRQNGASRPTSVAISTRTDVTVRPTAARPVSDVPTVTIEAASPPANRDATVYAVRQYPHSSPTQPLHPWRSSTSSLSEAGNRASGRWRRASLSIQVPSIEPRQVEGASMPHSPAFDLCTPTAASQQQVGADGSAKIHDNQDLSRSLLATEMENRMLRMSLQEKEAELEHLRAHKESLAECLRTGNDMVRELSEERDELEERLRRISWYSRGGDPAWLGGGVRPERRGNRSTPSAESIERRWSSTSRRSPFQDQPPTSFA